MGIGAIYKELEFDGESSGDYGLYISGEGVFNSPARDVEMITIPGRNGAFALDHGRFENIEVVYPGGAFGSDESDFADKIREIRAWLSSKRGYVRLTDDYHPDEYRLAVYKGGLEVSPAQLKAGEFEVVFECMPQRFLVSGETAETIAASGDTLTNPTKFEARPLLEVNGYGTIGINGDEVAVISEALGRITILSGWHDYADAPTTSWNSMAISPNYDQINTGDPVYIAGGYITFAIKNVIGLSITGFNQTGDLFTSVRDMRDGETIRVGLSNMLVPFGFNKGTAASASATITVQYRMSASLPITTSTVSLSATITSAGVISFSVSSSAINLRDLILYISSIYGDSSQSALGNPLYFDLDIGEAYKIEGGDIVSVNNAVVIPADLPELKPGANVITFENTVSQLKIVPRWWTI